MASTDSAERSGKLSRARILTIAADQFAAYGYRGASLARIAAQVGLTQPGLLHHFPSKASLLHAVLVDRDQRDLKAVMSDVDKLEEMDLEGMVEFLELIARRNADHRNSVQLAHLTAAEATGADHPAHDWAVDRMNIIRGLCQRAVLRSIDAGSVRADVDPTIIANLLIAASEGLENQWLLDPEVDLAAGFRFFADALYGSISAAQK